MVHGDFANHVDRPREENAFALTERVWLYDVRHFVLLVLIVMRPVVPEVGELTRQQPRLGKEVVFLWKHFVHAHQVSGQVVLLRDATDTRIHVYLLIRLQFLKEVWGHA